ncbi:hypothetical protein JN00_0093 [Metamycoplasma subdolum]|uniref:Uncharacterized protein n=1 Tax=Metamycoplasma subdolum TaxID=92407 RepID=A0A3M0A320_9BACT|nr:hypothetical protein [Metamycoplasma subdolum]RMA79046.1 hypothetical protein JN00_0093 [Metamycoplasma subdolum]WPB50570.1 hypothetical protein R9C05_00185 [Metamycoplasma subdolum]
MDNEKPNKLLFLLYLIFHCVMLPMANLLLWIFAILESEKLTNKKTRLFIILAVIPIAGYVLGIIGAIWALQEINRAENEEKWRMTGAWPNPNQSSNTFEQQNPTQK